jgi:predicted nucleotidyltransferase
MEVFMDRGFIKKRIISALTPLNPAKVILFGSCASGKAKDDSDVDIYIVSNEDYIPASYAENMRHYKKYSRPLKALKQDVALDVIVHTRAMNRMFEDCNSSFACEIIRNGERLI